MFHCSKMQICGQHYHPCLLYSVPPFEKGGQGGFQMFQQMAKHRLRHGCFESRHKNALCVRIVITSGLFRQRKPQKKIIVWIRHKNSRQRFSYSALGNVYSPYCKIFSLSCFINSRTCQQARLIFKQDIGKQKKNTRSFLINRPYLDDETQNCGHFLSS